MARCPVAAERPGTRQGENQGERRDEHGAAMTGIGPRAMKLMQTFAKADPHLWLLQIRNRRTVHANGASARITLIGGARGRNPPSLAIRRPNGDVRKQDVRSVTRRR